MIDAIFLYFLTVNVIIITGYRYPIPSNTTRNFRGELTTPTARMIESESLLPPLSDENLKIRFAPTPLEKSPRPLPPFRAIRENCNLQRNAVTRALCLSNRLKMSKDCIYIFKHNIYV